MKDYHYAWLQAHPGRTEEWLREHLADGFRVHHLDGDHSNNDPANLMLIDGSDHLALHRKLEPVRVVRSKRVVYRKAEPVRTSIDMAESSVNRDQLRAWLRA